MSGPGTSAEQHPRCTIVPPYLLQHLEQHANPLVQARARATLAADAAFRAAGRLPAPRATAAAVAPATTGTGSVDRTVFDAQNTQQLPGAPVRTEGQAAVEDVAVNEAYDGLGHTWDLFFQAYGRDSLDGAGMPLLATVHYGEAYANAFWDGERMVFGDGDGEVFERFTAAVDVIGHELTHGVTELTAGLRYQGQSGALNESLSDVFGSLVRQRLANQRAEDADWLIGAGLFTPAVQGVALRSMKAPGTAYDDDALGKDPQPATMADYVETDADNGGVHINSGIPNHAFYLAAVAIGGLAWERAGQVWYDVLTGGTLATDVDFAGFATATVEAATVRFGADAAETTAIAQAWEQVGVEVTAVGAAQPVTAEAGGGGPGAAPTEERAEVYLCRTGGFGGLTRECTFRPAELGEPDAGEWSALLRPGVLPEPAATPAPDRFVYRVVAPSVDVTVAEQDVPGPVRDLFDRTLRQA